MSKIKQELIEVIRGSRSADIAVCFLPIKSLSYGEYSESDEGIELSIAKPRNTMEFTLTVANARTLHKQLGEALGIAPPPAPKRAKPVPVWVLLHGEILHGSDIRGLFWSEEDAPKEFRARIKAENYTLAEKNILTATRDSMFYLVDKFMLPAPRAARRGK